MFTNLHHLISQKNLVLEQKDPFLVTVKDSSEGFDLAKEILYDISNKKTLLFLSGGRTPKDFYSDIAKEEKLSVGAVGLIDERFGKKMHLDSNEWMIQQTGLLGYFQYQHTPFYPILQKDMTLENTALQYDEQLRFLLNGFSQSIGVLGIGIDGHIAGLPIHTAFDTKEQSLVTSFTDFPGPQKQRISMTFLGLSMLDIMLVLVFGEDKKHALQAMLSEGNEEDIPARFFKRKDIAQKTLIITDQKV